MSAPYHGRTAIASAFQTEFSQCSGCSVLQLARTACLGAIDAVGLRPKDVDGVVQFGLFNDSVPAEVVGAAIGSGDLSYVMDFAQGGQSACYMAMHAAMAVEAGLANTVLVYRALNGRSGVRIGRVKATGGASGYRYPLGFGAYPHYTAMWARRYLLDTGSTEADLGAIAVALRRWALLNERAVRTTPLSLDDYFASPYIAEPYRVEDCTIEVDGAAAILVTSLERAVDLHAPPIVISGSAWSSHGYDGDMGSSLLYDDYSRNFTNHLRERLWGTAGLGPEDVDVAELYDCFTGALAQNIEGLGLVERGAAGTFAREGHMNLGGRLPVNTNGGLLSEGYLHGMNTLTEAVWQLQGTSGSRQVDGAKVAVACSGAMHSGAAIVLTALR